MKKSHKKNKRIYLVVAVLVLAFITLAGWYLSRTNIAVLNPKGPIAQKEFHLIVFAVLLSSTVVIPVYILTIVFAWKYRESNKSAKYSPELDHNRVAETIWWVIPSVLIVILATVAWNSSHQLDPYKPIASNIPTMNIQVVALDWKWLFIYPKQDVASVNFVQFPTNTPINFEITSDAPMNSFWIPQLSGQIYAMPGMATRLNLLASQAGSYNGSSANISGVGFAGMTFMAKASSEESFNTWVSSVKKSPSHLSLTAYNQLSQPSQNNPVSVFASAENGLFNQIINKYMVPPNGITGGYVNTQPDSQMNMNMQSMGMGM